MTQGLIIRRGEFAIDREFSVVRNAWVRDGSLSTDARILYLFIYGCAPEFEVTYAVIESIGISEYRATKAIRALEDAGYVRVTRARDAQHRQLPNEYELVNVDPDEADPKNSGQPVENVDRSDPSFLGQPVDNSGGELTQKTRVGSEQGFSEDPGGVADPNSLGAENLGLKEELLIKRTSHHHPDGTTDAPPAVAEAVDDDDGSRFLAGLGVDVPRLRRQLAAVGRDLDLVRDLDDAALRVWGRTQQAGIADPTRFLASALQRGWTEFTRVRSAGGPGGVGGGRHPGVVRHNCDRDGHVWRPYRAADVPPGSSWCPVCGEVSEPLADAAAS